MQRLFTLITLTAICAFLVVPALLELEHHENGLASVHYSCDGDCGCLCHTGVTAILSVDQPDTHTPVLRAEAARLDPFVNAFITLLERPPELFS